MRFCSTTVQEELTEEVDEDKSLKQGATALPWKTIDKMNHPLKDKKVHCILRTQEAYCWQTIAGSTCCMSVAFHFIHFWTNTYLGSYYKLIPMLEAGCKLWSETDMVSGIVEPEYTGGDCTGGRKKANKWSPNWNLQPVLSVQKQSVWGTRKRNEGTGGKELPKMSGQQEVEFWVGPFTSPFIWGGHFLAKQMSN